jgi:ribosomal-protein-alanine N-acetyltransferase
MWTDPDVRLYLWDDVVIDRETAAGVVEQNVADWTTRGYGLWLITEKEIAGFVGFRSSDEGPELLFGLLPAYWHRGFATEAGEAALRYLFAQGHDHAWGATDPPNVASMRVMERIGMTFDRHGTLDGLDAVFYRIMRPQP